MTKISRFKLTQDNYYDKDTDYKYLSFSIFRQFVQNEAAALAALKGEYDWFDNKTPLLVGNYVHSYFESAEAHQEFKKAHPEMISQRGATKGQLKKDFVIAEKMIKRLESEPMFGSMLKNTSREVILTGKIGEQDWKGKLDAVNVKGGYFIDFKTIRSLVDDGAEWSNYFKGRVNFIKSRFYYQQMAIYAELLKQKYKKTFDPVIWAVSKEEQPVVKAYTIDDNLLEIGLSEVIDKQDRVAQVINGEVVPELIDDGSRYFNEHYHVAEIREVTAW